MGLFTRTRPAPVPVRLHWTPDGDEPQMHSAAVVDDEGCASEQVHSVRYILPGAPDASVTIFLYPAYAGPDPRDGYILGWHWQRHLPLVGECVGAGWDSFGHIAYGHLAYAEDEIASRAWFAAQAQGPWPAGDHGPNPFDWDGRSR